MHIHRSPRKRTGLSLTLPFSLGEHPKSLKHFAAKKLKNGGRRGLLKCPRGELNSFWRWFWELRNSTSGMQWHTINIYLVESHCPCPWASWMNLCQKASWTFSSKVSRIRQNTPLGSKVVFRLRGITNITSFTEVFPWSNSNSQLRKEQEKE